MIRAGLTRSASGPVWPHWASKTRAKRMDRRHRRVNEGGRTTWDTAAGDPRPAGCGGKAERPASRCRAWRGVSFPGVGCGPSPWTSDAVPIRFPRLPGARRWPAGQPCAGWRRAPSTYLRAVLNWPRCAGAGGDGWWNRQGLIRPRGGWSLVIRDNGYKDDPALGNGSNIGAYRLGWTTAADFLARRRGPGHPPVQIDGKAPCRYRRAEHWGALVDAGGAGGAAGGSDCANTSVEPRDVTGDLFQHPPSDLGLWPRGTPAQSQCR